MNKELLNTPIVKGQIKRYLSEDYILEHILDRLHEIHLIQITVDELIEFIEKEQLNKDSCHHGVNRKIYKSR